MGLIEKIAADVAEIKAMIAQLAAAVADGGTGQVTLEPAGEAEPEGETTGTDPEDDFGDQGQQAGSGDDLGLGEDEETSTAQAAPATTAKTSKTTVTSKAAATDKAAAGKTKATPGKAATADKAVTGKKVGIDDVRKAIREYAALEGEEAAKGLLKKFNAAKISDLKEDSFAKVIAATAT